MHNVPADSVFLANKFIGLAQQADVHLLVWDNKQRVQQFIAANNLQDYATHIHIGISAKADAYKDFLPVLKTAMRNSAFRSLLGDKHNLKRAMKYWPVFQLKPDIIHFEFGTLASDIEWIKKHTGSKLIVSFRGYDLNYIGLTDSAYYQPVWQYADGLHFLGNDLRSRAIRRGYKADKQEAIIPPAIDTNFWKPGLQSKQNEKLQIVSTGRLTWKKGYEYAIAAMKLLKDKGVPFEYRIIGEGNHRQALEYAIYENNLQDCVWLCGSKLPLEVLEQLQKADVFLHSAISEGFCNAVIEAQACGLPVVCTDADGLAENIADWVTGFVVPKWNANAMAEKLQWCADNKNMLTQIGAEGVKRVNEKFRIEDQLTSFLNFYRVVHES